MCALWGGRFKKELNQEVNSFNSSLHFDCEMFESDIIGSIAHATMLGNQRIITKEDSESIVHTLLDILNDIKQSVLNFDCDAEDIHMYIESELTSRIGDIGKKFHTARSRNDQVALDLRMHLRTKEAQITELLMELKLLLIETAKLYKETIMPGYTHLQMAQLITLANHLLAYAWMFNRDIDKLADWKRRMNLSPLGSCALAGTTYPIDREFVAKQLQFDGVVENSLDGVSDRDFVIELASCISLCMMHLSRLSEEIILWSSFVFKFIELDDAYATGSSIMPQKKNLILPSFLEVRQEEFMGI